MATAEAAAEIVREIAAVGAADLASAAEPLRADCLRLARKVSLLSHLVAEVAEAGAGAWEAESEAWVAELVRALQAARRFVALGRRAPTTGASDQVRTGTFGCADLSAQAALLGSWCADLCGIQSNTWCAASSLRVLMVVLFV